MDPAGWVHRFSSPAPPKGARQFERSSYCTRDGCCALLYQGRLNLTRAVCRGLSHSAASDSTQYFRAALCWCVAVHCFNLGFLTCLSTSVQELQPQSSQVRVPVTVGSHAGCKILGLHMIVDDDDIFGHLTVHNEELIISPTVQCVKTTT